MMFLPRIQISPSPFSSGLAIIKSQPSMAKPAAVKENLLGVWVVKQPVVSLIPYKLNKIMSSEPKYSIDAFLSGAAPKKKLRHWSRPSCYLMRLRIRKLATEYMKGGSVWF